MWKTKMTSKGQVTIPKAIREKIGLNPGDTLEIRETQLGYVLSKSVNPEVLRKYVGCAGLPNVTSDELMKELRGEGTR